MIINDQFLPFFGVVEDIVDPDELGRVKVRCYGYHTDNKQYMPTDFLRWMTPLVSNSAGVSGIGSSPTGFVTGSTVFGYFLNREMQDGIVVGSIAGKPIQTAIQNQGFNDPLGVFPSYINESDVNRLARNDNRHWLFNIRANARVQQIQKPFNQGEYDEPPYNNQAKYPNNDVLETTAGHLKEYDSTPDQERIHEYHKQGTYYEIDPSGNRVVKVVGDGYEIVVGNKYVNVRGSVNLTVEGDVNQYIKGNHNVQIDGNKTEIVLGDRKEFTGRSWTHAAGGSIGMDGTTIDLNSGVASGNASLPVTLPVEYSIETAAPVLKSAGRFAALDEKSEIGSTPSSYPPDIKPDGYDGDSKKQSDAQSQEKQIEETIVCSTNVSDGINYNQVLASTSYTIGDLSSGALFNHNIRAQGGLTEQDIVCNLESLAIYILEPLRNQYGSFRINSGFRVGGGRSQHNLGQAVDIQEPSWSYDKYLEVSEWIANNLPHDQLILEHGNAIWLHVSFNSSSRTQRGQLLTMLDGQYEDGLKLYYG
jgi:hypothetical protein